MRRESLALAVLGQVLIAVVSVGQSLVILLVAGAGPRTDAFLAAYSAYLPLGTLAATLRISAVPIGPGQERAAVARTARLALTLGVAFAALSPLLALALTRTLPDEVRGTAFAALLILAVAGAAQIATAGCSAALSIRGGLFRSGTLYAAGGSAGLVVSTVALLAIGPVGAAVGVAVAAVAILVAHLRALGMGPSALISSETPAGLRGALQAAAIPIAVQLHLLVVLAFAPREPHAITALTYSFLFYSLLLSASAQVVGALGLARSATMTAAERVATVRPLIVSGLPTALSLAAPATALVALAGPPLVALIPASVIEPEVVDRIFGYLGPLGLVALPWALVTLLFPCAVALQATRRVALATLPGFAALAAAVVVLADPLTRWEVVAALGIAELVYAAAALVALLGAAGAMAVARPALARSAPVVALCGGLAVIGYHGAPVLIGAGAALAAALLLRAVRAASAG